jgi:hypothetical protein
MRKSRDHERLRLRTWIEQVAELRRPGAAAEPFDRDAPAREEKATAEAEESSLGGWAREASS